VLQNDEGKEEIGVIEDGTLSEEAEFFDAEQVPIMQLSINALLSTSHITNTFTLQVKIGKHTATSLVDTGSDTSFINAKFALKTKHPISTIQPVKVVAANGKHMMRNTTCVNCPYNIQGHTFTSDFRLLEV
jgi:hypothetical protein